VFEADFSWMTQDTLLQCEAAERTPVEAFVAATVYPWGTYKVNRRGASCGVRPVGSSLLPCKDGVLFPAREHGILSKVRRDACQLPRTGHPSFL